MGALRGFRPAGVGRGGRATAATREGSSLPTQPENGLWIGYCLQGGNARQGNSVVAVEKNQVAKDTSGKDENQTGNGQDERSEEVWIEPEEADTSKAGEKQKHGAPNEASLNQVDNQTNEDESDGGDLGTVSGQ